MKGTVKIAYWDTEQRGRTPPLLGQIQGTPTIRFFKPKKKQGNSNRKKDVLDYQFERKAKDMKRFLDANIPNFIERVNGSTDFTAFEEKAARNGLPRAMLFTSKPHTSSLTKYLSTEFRRKLLLAELYPSKNNKEIMDKYNVKELPALIVITEEDMVIYDKNDYTRNRLQSFLSKYALKEPVFPKKKEEPKVEL